MGKKKTGNESPDEPMFAPDAQEAFALVFKAFMRETRNPKPTEAFTPDEQKAFALVVDAYKKVKWRPEPFNPFDYLPRVWVDQITNALNFDVRAPFDTSSDLTTYGREFCELAAIMGIDTSTQSGKSELVIWARKIAKTVRTYESEKAARAAKNKRPNRVPNELTNVIRDILSDLLNSGQGTFRLTRRAWHKLRTYTAPGIEITAIAELQYLVDIDGKTSFLFYNSFKARVSKLKKKLLQEKQPSPSHK